MGLPEKKVIFISDLHLSAEELERTERFLRFIERHREGLSALYILGDFLDFWIGPRGEFIPAYATILKSLKGLVESGVEVTYLAGNRDYFGIREFEKKLGLRVFMESTTIELDGRRIYLTHGDGFHIEKGHLKAGRCFWLKPWWEWIYCRFPLWLARFIRSRYIDRKNRARTRKKGIFRFPPNMFRDLFEGGVDIVVCGHSHELRKVVLPANGDSPACSEKVIYTLGSWYSASPYLEYSNGRFELKNDMGEPDILDLSRTGIDSGEESLRSI